ncbi:hypothetical protein O3M35_006557 [Rhynocoris fuscipes]|uniref:Uncharacterized protein n=1 Tax=Rhynocoris fuscipes TaxID=488301 RepID=A0AAW1DLM3_9HEMI
MDLENVNYSVNNNWAFTDESVSLKDLISFEDSNNSEWLQLTEEEIGQFVNLDENFSPLQLVRHNKNEPCMLKIYLNDSGVNINKLIVISEARIIELYGKHGEYLCTEKAHALGYLSGKKFYIAQPSISDTKEIAIKFCENGDTLWLYGITLFIRQSQPTKSDSLIDFTNVDQILRNSSINLSENAERAKNFIKNYNLKKNTSNDSEILQNLLEKYGNILGNNSSKIISLIEHRSDVDNNEILMKRKENDTKDTENDIKNYVDKKLQQLEERVQNNLELQLKEFEQKQNEKLDNIIQLLQKKL